MEALQTVPPDTVGRALAEAASLGSFFALTVGGPDTGWQPISDAYDAGVPELIDAAARRLGSVETRIAASIVQLGHAARLWSPVLFCAIAHGILPDLAELQQARQGAALRLPAPRGHRLTSGSEPVRLLYETIVTGHLDRMAAGLKAKVAVGLLYGNAASALAEAARTILQAHPGLRGPVVGLVDGLLGTGRLVGTGHIISPGLAFRRRSCCLYYRTPGGEKCGDCSFLARSLPKPQT